MACGNNWVSRGSLSSAPRDAPRIEPPKNSPEEMIRSGRLLGTGRVADAFIQNKAGVDHKGDSLYRDERTGKTRDTRIVRIQQADGTSRHISIRERVNAQGLVTDIFAEDGIKSRIDTGGDHAHWKRSDQERSVTAHRDSLGSLLDLLKDFGQHDFSGGLGVLGGKSVPFVGRHGKPRDPNK